MGWDDLISGLAGVGESALSGLGSGASWIGNAVRANPLQSLGLGLGLGGDIMSGLSQYTSAQQQRDLRNKLMDPAYMNAMTNQYYGQNVHQLQSQLPAILRQTVNPMLGMSGVDPSGGTGKFIMDQAIAQQLQNAYANARNSAFQGVQSAGQFIQPNYGAFGGTANAMQMMGQLNALRGNQSNQPGNPGDAFANTSGLSLTQPGYNYMSNSPYANYDFSSLMQPSYTPDMRSGATYNPVGSTFDQGALQGSY